MSSTLSPSNTPKVWLVTGASSGFGRLTTECALKNGDRVIATLRTPSMISDLSARYPPSQLLVLQLDVCDGAAIKVAFAKAIATFHRIDVVFNNAGFILSGEAEGMSDEGSRAIFDTMFWGASNVMREAISCFRDVNCPMGGHLLNVSSRTTLVTVPTGGMYAAAKGALDSLTEGYAAELDPKWNIRLVLLQPALFRTPAVFSSRFEPPPPAYASNPSLPSMRYRLLLNERLFNGDPGKFAQLVCRIVRMEGLPPFARLPVHRVAVDAARKKGQIYVEAADKLIGWIDDPCFDELK